MSQIELNETIVSCYFGAYNKNETIFDEIISYDCLDHAQSAYMGSQVRRVGAAKHELKNSLEKLDEDFDYAVEANIASKSYPDLVGAYCKGSLTPKATSSNTPQTSKILATEALAYTTFKIVKW
jgi:hypothetical protein